MIGLKGAVKLGGCGLLVGGLLVGTVACGGGEPRASQPETAAVTSHQAPDVHWEKDWDAAFARARAENKPVLVSFYADWCVWCKVLDSTTYRDAKVAGVLAQDVVPLSVDIDRADRAVLDRFRIDGPPTIVLLDTSGREMGRIPGYMPPTGFFNTLEGILHPDGTARG